MSLLERYGLPTALADEAYNVLHLSGGAGRFLRMADGDLSRGLLDLVHPDLRLELRAALFAVNAHGSREETRLVRGTVLAPDRPPVPIRLTVRPVEPPEGAGEKSERPEGAEVTGTGAHRYLLVQFEELPAELLGVVESEPSVSASAASLELARQLEEENTLLQRQLNSTAQQYEAITEELKASNEELQSMNEEQRSATEELETSQEELQSVNEELTTVNHELKARVDEVSRTNSDLQNFLASTDIGTIFVDRELRIKRYTPAAEALFNLIPADTGRPLAHVTHRLDYPGLTNDAESVLARLLPVEREVSTEGGERHFLARLLPYRSLDDRIEGVVLTFVDLSERRQAEAAQRESEERFRLLVEGAKEYAMFLQDVEGRITFWSRGAEHIFGWSEPEAMGQTVHFLFTPEDREQGEPRKEMETARTEGQALDRRWHIRRDGSRFWADGILMPLDEEKSSLRGYAKVLRDATEEKRAEEALHQAKEELEERVEERTRSLQKRTDELRQVSQMRQELLRQVVTVQEEERGRISRDLHDDTGQMVSALLLGLGQLRTSAPLAGDPAVQEQIAHLVFMGEEIAKKSHQLSFTLRPTDLDDIGLPGALENYAAEWSRWSGVPVSVDTVGMELLGTPDAEAGKPVRLPREVETTVYRVAQEALTNILRHAVQKTDVNQENETNGSEKPWATQVSILLQVQGRGAEVVTTIEDDGPGFDVETALTLPPGQRRLGLFGMQERARLAGGTLEIESTPGAGTTVFLRLPISPR